MSRKIEYQKGEQLGECIYLHDSEQRACPGGQKPRRAIFICKCGKEFIAQIYQVKSRSTKSCGCLSKEFITTHGLVRHPNYLTYINMMRRCYTIKDNGYKSYGGRGIIVCEEWVDSIESFINYITLLPNYGKPKLSLDRINNDGNYEPGNMRWATKHEQSTNRRRGKSKSKYMGVYKNGSGYYTVITINRKYLYIGTYKTENGAVNARNQYIIDNNLTEYKIQSYESK